MGRHNRVRGVGAGIEQKCKRGKGAKSDLAHHPIEQPLVHILDDAVSARLCLRLLARQRAKRLTGRRLLGQIRGEVAAA